MFMPMLLAFATSMLFAQPVQFEEASFRLAPPRIGQAAQPKVSLTPGRVAYLNVDLKGLIGSAYRISKSRISGGEEWISSARYDLQAIYPSNIPRDQIHEMIKALLIERIGLRVHIIQKESPTYAMIVDKRGARLKPVEQDE